MTTVMICLVIAVAMPYLLAFGSLRYRFAQFGGPDARNPRIQAAKLEGAGQRIVAAQENAWEALLMFLATLFLAFAANVPEDTIARGAMIFAAARILHPIFYVADIPAMRTLSWLIATGSCVWLIVLAF